MCFGGWWEELEARGGEETVQLVFMSTTPAISDPTLRAEFLDGLPGGRC